jgi:hypothetical protein
MVQRRINPATMPLDEATVEWPEAESPYVHVATLVLPRQDIDARGQAEYGQSLAFNIFRVPPEQAPVPESSIAAVRKAVYAASPATRHEANGQPLRDVPQPRIPAPPAPEPDDCVVKAAIYPSIGIARVGNSPEEYFIGPEVPHPATRRRAVRQDQAGACGGGDDIEPSIRAPILAQRSVHRRATRIAIALLSVAPSTEECHTSELE